MDIVVEEIKKEIPDTLSDSSSPSTRSETNVSVSNESVVSVPIDELITDPINESVSIKPDSPPTKRSPSPIFPSYDTLVLSSGGSKGILLLGAIQAANDEGLLYSVNTYVGSSVGSIIGYLLAIGYSPVEIIVELHRNQWIDQLKNYDLVAMINGNGATRFTPIQEALEQLTINKIGRFLTLEGLRKAYCKTLVCCTYNMTSSQVEYLSHDNYPDLPCITALKMSANIPLMFDRFKYMDSFYVDGAIANNFPIDKGDEIGSSVLGLNIEPNLIELADDPEQGVLSYIFKLLRVPVNQSTEYRCRLVSDKCTIVPIATTEFKGSLGLNVPRKIRFEMFSSGYKQFKEKYKM